MPTTVNREVFVLHGEQEHRVLPAVFPFLLEEISDGLKTPAILAEASDLA